MADCIHDLDERTCATCKHGPRHIDAPSIEARAECRYPSVCAHCDDDINPGDPIALVARHPKVPEDDDGVWLHAAPCAEEVCS